MSRGARPIALLCRAGSTVLTLGCGQLLGVDEYHAGPGPDPLLEAAAECGPLQAPSADGRCVPVGVASCGDRPGFLEPDDAGGCQSPLPRCTGAIDVGSTWACAERRCATTVPRAVYAPPGAPIRYVGPGAANGDGSVERPWGRIQEALEAADQAGDPHAYVVLFPGVHDETLVIRRPVTLESEYCAEIRGADPGAPVITLEREASGSVLNQVAVRGGGGGIVVRGASSVTLTGLNVTDTEGPGVRIEGVTDPQGATRVQFTEVRGSRGAGILLSGAHASLADVAVRRVRPNRWGAEGRGLVVAASPLPDPGSVTTLTTAGDAATSPRSTVAVEGALIEECSGAGVWVEGSDAVLDRVVVRDTAVEAVTGHGSGVVVQPRHQGYVPASLEIRRSLVERSAVSGIFVDNARALVEDTTLRDVGDAGGDACLGRGIRARFSPMFDGETAPDLTVARVLVEGARETGVLLEGVRGTISDSLIREVPGCDGPSLGDGLALYGPAFAPADVTLANVRISGTRGAPVVRFGSTARLTTQGGLFDDCAPAAAAEGATGAMLGAVGGACACEGRLSHCSESRTERVPALRGLEGCVEDDRTACLDNCSFGYLGPTSTTGHLVQSVVPQDEMATSVGTHCGVLPLPRKREVASVVGGRDLIRQMTTLLVDSSRPPAWEAWALLEAAGNYGSTPGWLGAAWSLDHGILGLGVYRRMSWSDPKSRQTLCAVPRPDASGVLVPDCIAGVSLELSAPSAGIVYNRANRLPDPLAPGGETSIAGTAVAGNLPPGLHEIRLRLPPGVRCDPYMDGTEETLGTAWPTGAPDTYRVPIVAGTMTMMAVYCDDDRQGQ